METGSLLLILALLLLVGLFVARPFLEDKTKQSFSMDGLEHEHSALLAERERLLNALRELEFDFNMGKIPEEDFPGQRLNLMQRGAEVLRRLDELYSNGSPALVEEPPEPELVGAAPDTIAHNTAMPIEHRVGSRITGAPVASPDDSLEVMIANRRRARNDKACGFCPKCGNPLQKSDRYCPKCGSGAD